MMNPDADAGDRMYVCEKCEKHYTRKSRLLRHIHMVHAGWRTRLRIPGRKSAHRKPTVRYQPATRGRRPNANRVRSPAYQRLTARKRDLLRPSKRGSALKIPKSHHQGAGDGRTVRITPSRDARGALRSAHSREARGEPCALRSTTNRRVYLRDARSEPCGWPSATTQRRYQYRGPFTCHFCGEMFSYEFSVNRHFREVHQGFRPYGCFTCDKTFACQSYAAKHASREHGAPRPYGCPLCRRTFVHWKTRHIHLWTIHRDPSYSCHICGKTFTYRFSVASHVRRIHRHPEPYKCYFCDEAFAFQLPMADHMRFCH